MQPTDGFDPFNAKTSEQPPVIASNKTSLSNKSKKIVGAAGTIVLLAVSVTGLTLWQNQVSQAEGEASLGSNVVTSFETTESPYFSIDYAKQRSIGFKALGDAAHTTSTNVTLFADGWRVERTTTPDDSDSWVVAAVAHRGRADGAGYSVVEDDASVLIARGHETQVNDPNKLQPLTTYYYRIAQQIQDPENYDENAPWVPKPEVLHVTTSALPTLSVEKLDGNQVTVAWNSTALTPKTDIPGNYSGLPPHVFGRYSVRSSTTPVAKYQASNGPGTTNTSDWKPMSDQQGADGYLKPGSTLFVQPTNSTRYYFLEINGLAIMDSIPVTSGSKEGSGLVTITTTVTNKTIPINGLYREKITAKILTPPLHSFIPRVGISLHKGTRQTSDFPGPYAYNGAICLNDIYPSDNTPLTATLLKFVGQNGVDSCFPPSTGAYTVVTKTHTPQGYQTNVFPVTFSKLAPTINSSVKKSAPYRCDGKQCVTLTIKTKPSKVFPYGYPAGTYTLKNLNTNKVIKQVKHAYHMPQQEFKLKNVKPGKYKLAVIYTPGPQNHLGSDPSTVIFTKKTNNLPSITVKK